MLGHTGLLDAGEPFGDWWAAELFRTRYYQGVRTLLTVLCDDDGLLPVAAARRLLLAADALASAGATGTRNLGSIALAAMASANAAPRPPPSNDILELLRSSAAPRPAGARESITAGELLEALGRHGNHAWRLEPPRL